MKTWIPISLAFFLSAGSMFGQAAPDAASAPTSAPTSSPTSAPTSSPTPSASTSSPLSWADGTVHYSLSASEIVQYGYYNAGSTTSSTALSGLLGYSSLSEVHPTTLLFATGVVFGQGGQGTTTYQNFAITQSLIKGRWNFNVTDSFSFLPQSPVTGVAGVPGINNPGIDGPSQGPAGGVLTFSGNRISNLVSGMVERDLTARTSLSGTGSWTVLHFLDKDAGLDTSTTSGQVGINHRFDSRNTGSVSAVYSTFNTVNFFGLFPPGFPLNEITYQTKGVNVSYSRLWTRSLSTSFSGGPLWIQSSAAPLIPNQLNFSLTGSVNYNRRLTSYSVMYSHGVSGGSGVQPGALSDNINASVRRTFNKQWAASATMYYTRSSGLVTSLPGVGTTNNTLNTEYGTLQVTRGFTRTISGYASYTAQNQSVPAGFYGSNAFNGLSHIFALGVTWSPQSNRLGDF